MKVNYWIYIKKEITDLIEPFSKVFDVKDFYRDYENVWEWIDGNSDELKAKVNISRKHNWESGEYDEPLMIRLEFKKEPEKEKIKEIGNLIAKEFQTETMFGQINYLKGNEFQYVELNKFV